jgi:hypothetical protein
MIKLNDILNLDNLSNVKVRFNLMFRHNWNPIEVFEEGDMSALLEGQYWNYKMQKSYKNGQITIGFLKINPDDDLWLLFHVGRVTKDLNKLNTVGYEYETIREYEKFFGRLIVRYKNSVQMMIRKAESVFEGCEVSQILPDRYDNDIFPGYEKINISWKDLSRVITKDNWKTALQNQKGVYLIIDTSNGKKYVGSAYGQNMLLGRWQSYVKTGHGGNTELRKLSIDHIRNYFRFSILDIYKSTIDDQLIIQRESWWKEVLQTRGFGYNEN